MPFPSGLTNAGPCSFEHPMPTVATTVAAAAGGDIESASEVSSEFDENSLADARLGLIQIHNSRRITKNPIREPITAPTTVEFMGPEFA